MIFSPVTVLSTSMKRSLKKKPFTIKFSGHYDKERRKFRNYKSEDFSAIRGMAQEIIKVYPWFCNVATSFGSHRVCDARKFISKSLKLFDPINFFIKDNSHKFLLDLVDYGSKIEKQKMPIRQLFNDLRARYDGLKIGQDVAMQILSAGWETGQMMRFMFLSCLHSNGELTPP